MLLEKRMRGLNKPPCTTRTLQRDVFFFGNMSTQLYIRREEPCRRFTTSTEACPTTGRSSYPNHPKAAAHTKSCSSADRDQWGCVEYIRIIDRPLSTILRPFWCLVSQTTMDTLHLNIARTVLQHCDIPSYQLFIRVGVCFHWIHMGLSDFTSSQNTNKTGMSSTTISNSSG